MQNVGRALLLALAVTLGAHPASGTDEGPAPAPVVVAILDTGIKVDHAEFGPGGAPIVAWWDFTREKGPLALPGPADMWDTRDAPYDLHGHGTAVAALVGGATVSLAPGTRLAIAKVADAHERIENVETAYKWAVETVGADIVSISLSSTIPLVGAVDDMDEAINAARAAGVLTIVAAGNGLLNKCGPATTWSTAWGYSPDVLAVGRVFHGGGPNAVVTCGQIDPDVVSDGYDVRTAGIAASDDYVELDGSSFAAPLVAGAAARIATEARASGADDAPERVESLILACARVMVWPYALHGAGYFHALELGAALLHASSTTTCAADGTWAVNRQLASMYKPAVVETMRFLMTEAADCDEIAPC